MKYGFAFLMVGFLSSALWAQEGEGEADPLGLTARWNNALEMKTNDGSASLKLGGRIMLDHAWFNGDNHSADGTEFRRVRLMLSGKVNKFEWKTQYDFARAGDTISVDGTNDPVTNEVTGSGQEKSPAFKDVYVGVSGVPYAGALRAGHFKEPFGLEELTSSKYITFMERSLTSVFVPSRNVGVMAHRTLENGTLAYGAFRTADNFGYDTGDGDYSITGRYTRLLRNEDDGKDLLHLGMAVSHRSVDGVKVKTRNSTHLGRKHTLGSDSAADGELRYGVEAAMVKGSFSLQAEFMGSSVDSTNSWSYTGWYVMGSYFLTGESRPYDTKKGSFKRVKPAATFAWGESWGATELAVRYGSLDISDAASSGEKLEDLSVGLNLYHNPTFRTMLNYVYGSPGAAGADDEHAFMVRWQVGF